MVDNRLTIFCLRRPRNRSSRARPYGSSAPASASSRLSVPPIAIPTNMPQQPLQHPIVYPAILAVATVVKLPWHRLSCGPDSIDGTVNGIVRKVRPFVGPLHCLVLDIFRPEGGSVVWSFEMKDPIRNDFSLW